MSENTSSSEPVLAVTGQPERPPKPTDDLFTYWMDRPTPPPFCGPTTGCRYCWPDGCQWAAQVRNDARGGSDGS